MSYHGWAPGSSTDRPLPSFPPVRDLDQMMQGSSRYDADLQRDYELQQQRILEHARTSREASLERMRQRYSQYVGDRSRPAASSASDASLRSAALLGSARRHVRLSHLVGDSGHSARPERDRTFDAIDWRQRASHDHRRSHSSLANLRPEWMSGSHHTGRGNGHELQSSGGGGRPSRGLEEAIKYLARLRSCESHSDRLASAKESGFILDDLDDLVSSTHACFSKSVGDFVLNTALISAPPPSSWLHPGCVFSGFQHANPLPSPIHRRPGLDLAQYARSPTVGGPRTPTIQDYQGRRPSQSWVNNVLSHTSGHYYPSPTSSGGRGSGGTGSSSNNHHSSNSSPGGSSSEEQWPVKVTINSVDYERMTLTGTMEAFEVPNKSIPPHEASITTHLEGEIVDFNRHTLETTSFNADAAVDSTYWRKLEPFRAMADHEVLANVVSQRWLSEGLNQNWILMRWKGSSHLAGTPCVWAYLANGIPEKCFVTPSEAQVEVTISGFYYTSLRRDNGQIEGLYYDPLSSPYQRLKLKPNKPTFPAYKFT